MGSAEITCRSVNFTGQCDGVWTIAKACCSFRGRDRRRLWLVDRLQGPGEPSVFGKAGRQILTASPQIDSDGDSTACVDQGVLTLLIVSKGGVSLLASRNHIRV